MQSAKPSMYRMPLEWGKGDYKSLTEHEYRCAVSTGTWLHRNSGANKYVLEFSSLDSKSAYEECKADRHRFDGVDDSRCAEVIARSTLLDPPLLEYQECRHRLARKVASEACQEKIRAAAKLLQFDNKK
jgi:hypothetical protein